MKKLIFGALACIALGFTACGDTLACYELTGKLKNSTVSSTVYVYTTKNAVQAAIDEVDPGKEFTWSYKKVNKAKSDCFGSKGITF